MAGKSSASQAPVWFEDVANAEAERLVREAAETNATSLSLAGLRISVLPAGLADLTQLRELDLSGCRRVVDFGPLAGLKELQSLNLSGCRELRQLGPLTELKELQGLDLSDCVELREFGLLAVLIGLQRLNLSWCQGLRDLGPLMALRGLQRLDLSGCGSLSELQSLATLTELQGLDLRYCGKLLDLGTLSTLTGLQSLNLGGCSELREVEPLAALVRLQNLDLSYCGELRELGPLASFTGLHSLDLSGCGEARDLGPLAALTELRSLDLSGFVGVRELGPVAALTALQTLDLSRCGALCQFEPLSALTGLRSLDVSHCYVLRELGPLAALTGLQRLDLSHCGERRDLRPLGALCELQSLGLGGWYEVRDFGPLAALTGLRSLDLSHCRELRELAPLAALTDLHSLDLSRCRELRELGPLAALTGLRNLNLSRCSELRELGPLAALTGLQNLDLSDCGELRELGPLAGLTGLQSLHLRDCAELRELEPLATLTRLESLDLSGCGELRALGPLAALSSLTELNAHGVSFDGSLDRSPANHWPRLHKLITDRLAVAPTELGSEDFVNSCLERVERWQSDLRHSGAEPNTEVKLLVLGNGTVGKTQICRRLRGQGFDAAVPSTHGIQLGRFEVLPPRGDDPAAFANVWDFGGQDIYLGTHALFLDARAVYLIVWSPSHENDDEVAEESGVPMRNRPLGYWLEYVRSLAGGDAPVIVVQSRCDRETDVSEAPVPADHGFVRLQRTACSALNDDGLERLWPELRAAVRYLRQSYAQVLLPKSWVAVGESLRALAPQRTLERAEFDRLCTEVHGASVPSVVLGYLHRSGQVFWRADAFGGLVVLDQAWALEGVYAVLNRGLALRLIRERGGLFTPELLAAVVWDAAGYAPAEQALFLSMMLQCGACFQVAEGQYIVPELLPAQAREQSRIDAVWRHAPVDAQVRLRYGFLHDSLWRAVMCAVGERAGAHAVYWREGVCFHDAERGTTVRLWRDMDGDDALHRHGSVWIDVAGSAAAAFAEHLAQSVAGVRHDQAAQVVWERGAPMRAEASAPTDGREAPFSQVPPATPRPAAGARPQVHVSYAWGDDSEALLDGLQQALDEHGFDLQRDRSAMRNGEWISRFMQQIGLSRCVLVVVNASYLRSAYCLRELLYLWQASLGDRQRTLDKVIPLVLDGAGIGDAVDRLGVVRFWTEKRQELEQGTQGLDPLSWGESTRDQLLMIRDFEHRVADILSWLDDVLMPRGVAAIAADGYAQVIAQVRQRTARG